MTQQELADYLSKRIVHESEIQHDAARKQKILIQALSDLRLGKNPAVVRVELETKGAW